MISVEEIFPKGLLINEAKYKLHKIIKREQEINRHNLVYKTRAAKNDRIFDFQHFKTIPSFGRDIMNGTIRINRIKICN